MDFLIPANLGEAVEAAKRFPSYHILAGGTDLCVLMNSGEIVPKGLISISHLDGLKKIEEVGDFIEIGALATHSDISGGETVRKFTPALAAACKTVGARQIQNRGTIGGNVMNASPAGDTLPPLLAYDTSVEVVNVDGRRWIPFANFFKGYRETDLKKGELVTRFRICKALRGEKSAFLKIGTRKAQAISKVMGCFRLSLDGNKVGSAAVAFGSVASVPVRLNTVEKYLVGKKLTKEVIGKAGEMVENEVRPIDDIRSTANYRRHICKVLLMRFLNSI